jgi:Zn-dependent peptidase ImmA (M78 family)/transcriptional regulator with XRE-family HTH domain
MESNKYNPAMVTLAREMRGLTQTELATKIGVPQGTVSKLESGTLSITDELVRAIAQGLQLPESFFSQMDAVHPFGSTTFYHRRLQSVPAGILRKIEARVNVYRFHATRLLKATDLDRRCRFRRIDKDEYGGDIREIAELTRAGWNMPAGPVHNVIKSVESAGGIVIRFDFGTSKMFGLSEWNPPAPPLFFLNNNPEISADRDRFTLAHELGHVLLHAMPNPDMEKEANRFASEFLMPAKEIRAHLTPPIKLHTVARLKPFWKVSMAALIECAVDLGVINANQHVYLRMQLQQKGYSRREPAELDFPRERPTLLMEIIQAHVRELGFGVSDIARMVNMTTSEFRAFHGLDAEQYGGFTVVGR